MVRRALLWKCALTEVVCLPELSREQAVAWLPSCIDLSMNLRLSSGGVATKVLLESSGVNSLTSFGFLGDQPGSIKRM